MLDATKDSMQEEKKPDSKKLPSPDTATESAAQILLDHVADIFKDVAQSHFTTSKHKQISEQALKLAGLSSGARFAVEVGNLSQDLDASTRGMPTHHVDDNTLEASWQGLQQSEKNLEKMIAKPNLSENDEVAILHAFGQRLHTYQDFYAHSNYVEKNLKANPNLAPQQIPLLNFQDIPDGKAKDLHTGFYYYENSLKNEATEFWLSRDGIINKLNGLHMKIPGTDYLPTADYDKVNTFGRRLSYTTDPRYSVLHYDINKDDEKTDEGRTVNPNTKITLHDYARDLAFRQTKLEWSQLEATVRKIKGDEEGEKILKQMKNISFSNGSLRSLRFSIDGIITWIS